MISAGINDVKNNLSRLLARVKAGEEILITERGRPVARIVKENQDDKSIRAALEVPGKPVSDMVIEDRR